MGFKAPTAKAADYICVNSRCLYPQQDQGRLRHPAERTEDPCGASEKQAGQHPEGHSGAVRDRCQDRGGRIRALERPVRGQRRGDREVQQEDRLHQPEDQEPGGDPAGHREGLHRHQKRVRRGKPEDPGGLPAVSGGADRTAEAHQRAESGPAGCLRQQGLLPGKAGEAGDQPAEHAGQALRRRRPCGPGGCL